ncbi:hypothetical protein OAN307_c46150 [Octadecabacter antarcticus 307]|uniref:Dihydrodipicolinate reductase n=1 Tax=Octadecabacter antarcticus 307 TaxID=391626 RepID=M9RJI2_9RHOB|nr:hypothetical protein [Octadecabacter antarcticus]AGI69965.1 hypothetical protein OAN307_c46150 [Octadecabacter antarcticus 307]
MFRALALILTLCVALPESVQAFERINDRETFVNAVDGKDLRIAIYGLTLNVSANGTIAGRAIGWGISGSWIWEDGYFCRDMNWSGTAIDYNCQLVEVNGNRIRFTVDKGEGNDAVLRIR